VVHVGEAESKDGACEGYVGQVAVDSGVEPLD